MSKVTGVNASLEEFSSKFPRHVLMAKISGNFFVFNSHPKMVAAIEAAYEKATVQVIDSDRATYEQALKGKSAANLDSFKFYNESADKITIVIHSAPQEAFKVETATAYAKNVLAALKQATDIKFMVRGWLLESFREMGKDVGFATLTIRRPMLTLRDRSITTIASISVKDAPAIIASLSKIERVPECVFSLEREKKEFVPREKKEYVPREKKEYVAKEKTEKKETKAKKTDEINIEVG